MRNALKQINSMGLNMHNMGLMFIRKMTCILIHDMDIMSEREMMYMCMLLYVCMNDQGLMSIRNYVYVIR